MTALSVYMGLEYVLRQIEGIRAVVLGDPPTIQAAPLLIVAYGSFTHPLKNNPPARNLVGFDHLFAVRLAIVWQENPQAEMQLVTLMDQIPLAIDADPRLHSALGSGIAYCSDGASGFATYGKVEHRIVDYTIHAIEKYQGGA